jgi:signal transduction histidine kinase
MRKPPKLKLKLIWLSLVLLCLWILGSLFLIREHYREKRLFLDKFIERSQDVGLTMETLILPITRSIGMKKQMLHRTLSNLIKFGQFSAMALVNHRDEVMVVEPENYPLKLQQKTIGNVIFDAEQKTYTVILPLNLGRFNDDNRPPPHMDRDDLPPEMQRRLDAWRRHRDTQGAELLKPQVGIHQFVTIISAEQLEKDLAVNDKFRVALSLAALSVVIALIYAMARQERLTHLQNDLDKKELLNAELSEKNLAAAGLAHETRTPLGVVRGMAQLQSEDPSISPDIKERALLMIEEVDRITSRLNDFIEYSRMREPILQPTNLNEHFLKLKKLFRYDLEDAHIQLHLPASELPWIWADEDMLQQVFFNLIHNALQVCPQNSTISIHCYHNKTKLNCIVEDNGPGIPAEIADSLFRPYVTRRQNGTGLGLAVVRQICQRHQVSIDFENIPSGGTRFILSGFKLASQHLTSTPT